MMKIMCQYCIGIMMLISPMMTSATAISVSDSLLLKSYQYLLENVDDAPSDDKAVLYVRAWIAKARSEHNAEQLTAAYTAMMHFAAEPVKLRYCDSIVSAAQRTGNNELKGSALITRGITYYKMRRYKNALDDYLAADGLLARTTDKYLKHKVSFVIAQLKYHLGYYDESHALFAKCAAYFKNRDTIPYLRSMHGLAMSLNNLKKFEEAAAINKEGLAMAYKAGDRAVVPYLTQSDGITAYGRGQYKQAVSQLRMALPPIHEAADYASEGLTLLYMGKGLLALNQEDSAVKYLKEVDVLFGKHGYISPPLREAYELLIAYYDQQGDESNSLHYYRRKSAADKIFARDYRYLYDKITGEYNSGALKREIQAAKKEFQSERIGYVLVLLLLVFAVGFIVWRKKDPQPAPPPDVLEKQNAAKLISELNNVQLGKIKKGLAKFEKHEIYKKKKLSLPEFAKKLGSNTKYASAYIIHNYGINHSTYINDLRIKYVIDKLHNDYNYHKYSVKELSKDAGFSTPTFFSQEFRIRTGLNPSEYIANVIKPQFASSPTLLE